MSLSTEQQNTFISIWSKAVETQMHFNEMSVKSRQLGLTFVAAALGLAVVLLTRSEDFELTVPLGSLTLRLHVTVLLTLSAIIALLAVRRLDLGVYHKMLRGAVTFGEDFEENYMKKIFDLEKGMTQAISHFSRYDDATRERLDSGKYTYFGTVRVTAEDKIKAFYRTTTIFLLIATAVFFVVTNIDDWLGEGAAVAPKADLSTIIDAPSLTSR